MSEYGDIIKAKQGAESAHWYKKLDNRLPFGKIDNVYNAEVIEGIIGKNGNSRKPNKRDAKLLGFVWGTSNILNNWAKPGLEKWKLRTLLEASLNVQREENEPMDSYIGRIMQRADEHRNTSAERGKVIHADIQEFFKTFKNAKPYQQKILDKIKSGWGIFSYADTTEYWNELSFVNTEMGFGGTVDFLARLPEQYLIIDWKTTSLDKFRKPYDSWVRQLAAYCIGLELPLDRVTAVNVVIDNQNPDAHDPKLHIHSPQSLVQATEFFGYILEALKTQERQ